jgi:hypothetical protein
MLQSRLPITNRLAETMIDPKAAQYQTSSGILGHAEVVLLCVLYGAFRDLYSCCYEMVSFQLILVCFYLLLTVFRETLNRDVASSQSG